MMDSIFFQSLMRPSFLERSQKIAKQKQKGSHYRDQSNARARDAAETIRSAGRVKEKLMKCLLLGN